MKVAITAGGGRRAIYDDDLMADHYDRPGVVFEPAAEHSHDTEHAVARCVAEVGEQLVERDGIERLDDVLDAGGDDADAGSEDETGDDDAADAEPAPAVIEASETTSDTDSEDS